MRRASQTQLRRPAKAVPQAAGGDAKPKTVKRGLLDSFQCRAVFVTPPPPCVQNNACTTRWRDRNLDAIATENHSGC